MGNAIPRESLSDPGTFARTIVAQSGSVGMCRRWAIQGAREQSRPGAHLRGGAGRQGGARATPARGLRCRRAASSGAQACGVGQGRDPDTVTVRSTGARAPAGWEPAGGRGPAWPGRGEARVLMRAPVLRRGAKGARGGVGQFAGQLGGVGGAAERIWSAEAGVGNGAVAS
jgi:hypothetical protein